MRHINGQDLFNAAADLDPPVVPPPGKITASSGITMTSIRPDINEYEHLTKTEVIDVGVASFDPSGVGGS